MVRPIQKEDAKNYLKKAEEFIETAKQAILTSRFDAAGFNSIQAIINANDALTIFLLGKRASKDHREAIKMHVETIKIINDASFRSVLKEALDLRSEIGYSGKITRKDLAEQLVKNAVRFIEWVKNYVR